MLGVKRIVKVSNEIVYTAVGRRDKLALQVQHNDNYASSVIASDETRQTPICKYVLWSPDERHGKRSVGRPYRQADQQRHAKPPRDAESSEVKHGINFLPDLKPALFDAY
jgi:hypothetical protein